MLVPNGAIRQMTMERANSTEIQAEAMCSGMVTMRHGGYRKVLEGVTTLEEVARVSKAEERPVRARAAACDESDDEPPRVGWPFRIAGS